MTFHEAIEMGTLNGAKALGLSDVTGSLTVGKRADITRSQRLSHLPSSPVLR